MMCIMRMKFLNSLQFPISSNMNELNEDELTVYLSFKKIMCHVIKQSQKIDGKKKIMSWFFPGLPKVRISILLKYIKKGMVWY